MTKEHDVYNHIQEKTLQKSVQESKRCSQRGEFNFPCCLHTTVNYQSNSLCPLKKSLPHPENCHPQFDPTPTHWFRASRCSKCVAVTAILVKDSSWHMQGQLSGYSARLMIESLRIQIPTGVVGEFSSPWSTFCADSYFGTRTTPMLPQQHVKDPGHSAKSAGGRLQLNMHACTLCMQLCMT